MDRGWDLEEAVAHAVKMTEQTMATNIRDGIFPPKSMCEQGER